MSRIVTGQAVYEKGQKVAAVPIVRRAAQDQHCKLHIPGICRQHPQYTVGCHMRLFGLAGMAEKPDDIFIIDACDLCHAVFDSRDKWADAALGWDDVLRAFMKTLYTRRASGLILLKGEK